MLWSSPNCKQHSTYRFFDALELSCVFKSTEIIRLFALIGSLTCKHFNYKLSGFQGLPKVLPPLPGSKRNNNMDVLKEIWWTTCLHFGNFWSLVSPFAVWNSPNCKKHSNYMRLDASELSELQKQSNYKLSDALELSCIAKSTAIISF